MSAALAARLRSLGLSDMAEALARQGAVLDERDFEERLSEMLAARETARANRKLHTGLKRADLPVTSARLSEVIFRNERGFTRRRINNLRGWLWLTSKRNLVLTGASGTGKTWLASALAHEAVRAGYRVRCFDVQSFLQEWYDHETRNKLASFIAELSRAHLIVLDRWGLYPIDAHGAARLEEFVRGRAGHASLLLCSTGPVATWRKWLGNGRKAAEVVNGLVSRSNVITLK